MNTSIRSRNLASLLMVASFIACSDGGGGSQAPVVIAQATLDATGGTLAAPDDSVSLKVPSGALTQATQMTLESVAIPTGAVGEAYAIKPSGLNFQVAATLSVSYTPDQVIGHNLSELQVATYQAGRWQPLPGTSVDQVTHKVSGMIQSVPAAPYALVFVQNPRAGGTDAGIKGTGGGGGFGIGGTTSISRDAGVTFGGGPNIGGASNFGGSSGGGMTCVVDSASGPPGGPYPTCASSNPCSRYPGYKMMSCTNTTTGYSAQCCTTTTTTGTGGTSGFGGSSGTGGVAPKDAGTG